MRSPFRQCALAVGATAAVLLVTAPPAWAHPTWTVTVSGPIEPRASIVGTNVGNIVFTDVAHNTVTCPVSKMTGDVKLGTSLSNPLLSISTLTFGGASAPNADRCLGFGGGKVKITMHPALPLSLYATGHATGTADEVVGDLRVPGWRATIPETGECFVVIDVFRSGGVVPIKITNSTDRLTITTSDLVVRDGGVCDGGFSGKVSLTGTYVLNKDVTVTD